jgi:membrane protein DedA with SNARE-associated domain
VDFVFTWLTTYGYPILFLLLMLGIVGLPIPDETLLVFTGYLISKGTMHRFPAWATAVAGSWCGISLSYTIGRTLGIGVVHKYGKYLHVTEERLNRVHAWFDRLGHWVLFFGYYIAGVRHFSAILAGTSRLSFPSFMAFAWTGGLLWVTTFVTLGYFLGEKWREIAELIHHDLLYVSLALLAVVAAVYVWKRKRTTV